MKKIIYLIGAFVTTAAIIGAIAVMLNKLKISLSIEGIDDTLDGEDEKGDIDLSIENEPEAAKNAAKEADETEKSVEEALSAMDEDENADHDTTSKLPKNKLFRIENPWDRPLCACPKGFCAFGQYCSRFVEKWLVNPFFVCYNESKSGGDNYVSCPRPSYRYGYAEKRSSQWILAEIQELRKIGVDTFGLQIDYLKPEYRKTEYLKKIFSAMDGTPCYVTNYRGGDPNADDEKLAETLLQVADYGPMLLDLRADMFAPCVDDLQRTR